MTHPISLQSCDGKTWIELPLNPYISAPSSLYFSYQVSGLFFLNKFCSLFYFYFWQCWIFSAVCGLFSVCGEQGLLFVQACHYSSFSYGPWVLGTQASVAAAQGFQRAGSAAVAHGLGLSCPWRVESSQTRVEPVSLHWQADCQPLNHQGSPCNHS